MSKQTKNRRVSAYDHRAKASKARSEQRTRLAEDRSARERLVDQRRSEDAANAIAAYRAEKARAMAKGRAVAPTYEEYRERVTINATAIGDPA